MYGLSEQDRRIQHAARQFADELLPFEVQAELAGGPLPDELTQRHHEQAIERGLYATNMPASVGGRGCTMLQQVLVQEQVGRVTNGVAWVMHTPPAWWADVATEFQKECWLRPAVRGERHECYAITEEFAGSDVDAIAATAKREGDEYVVNGVKWHVTSYNVADYCFVQAKLDSGAHVLLVIDLPWPGVEIVRTPAYMHNIPDHHPIVSFTDVRVPATHLVGAEGDGMTFAHDWFRFERIMVGARCVGAAQRLLDEATAFAATREVGGQRLGDYQLVAAMLADTATELFAARSMLYEVARSVDAGADRKLLHGRASMIKLYCSEMAGRAADRAVQIFGGRGYMRENVAERMYRELRVERIWEGASELQRVIVARQLLNRGASALLED
ncbi:MAG TPA: acyl-CoA dehydrogenase family protein [Jatrophihabitantaceae bacterium]|jgi:alkylation response protein AidB-like acyl-CoA dehydrogenase|nr:acyl-CoA dehydrogenase family protein [Jatrophihabitantaceae bacterium]